MPGAFLAAGALPVLHDHGVSADAMVTQITAVKNGLAVAAFHCLAQVA
ncbi:hypothetical protein [Pantoea sp. GD03673]|nr:hypothetical protein [Pantoea sp. GD03673]MDH2067133.1 hypothetical protein [Pantoea sp. GD03673]